MSRETELAFVLACVSSVLRAPHLPGDELRQAALRVRDWEYVRSLSWNHGVLPLVHRALADAGSPSVLPPEMAAAFAASAAAIAADNLRLTSALLDVSDALKAAGVRAISYKGPVLAVRAYGDLSTRHFNDLDLLVARDDLPAVRNALAGIGYEVHGPVGTNVERAVLRWGHHLSFVGAGDTLVEVHWRFLKPLFGDLTLEGEVWRDARVLELAGRTLLTLSVTHELLVLVLHGSAHGWAQLSWIADFGALVRDWSNEDAGLLLAEAARIRLTRAMLLAFELQRLMFGAQVHDCVRQSLREHDGVVRAAATIARRLRAGAGPDPGSAWLQLALRERVRDKAAFVLRALFQPNPADFNAVRIPSAMFPLYYVIRPFRMVARYRPRRVFTG